MLLPILLVGFAALVDDAGVDRPPPAPATGLTPITEAAAPSAPTSATSEATPAADEKTGRQRFRRVAVYDLALDGVDPRVGRFVTDALVVELRKLDGVSVVSMDEVRSMLAHEAEKELVGCTEGASCLSEIGDALGADEILVGTLAVAAGSSLVTLRRLDQAQAKAMGTVTQRLKPDNGEEFLAIVGPAVDKLYPGHPLRAGQVRGVPPEQAQKLNPPPIPLWAPVSVGALSLVTLAGAAGVGVVASNEEAAQDALIEQARREPVPGSLVVAAGERAQSSAFVANVLYGAAAVVGLSALAMIPFTNFAPPTE